METPGEERKVSNSKDTKPGANGVIKTSSKKQRFSKSGKEKPGASVLTKTENKMNQSKSNFKKNKPGERHSPAITKKALSASNSEQRNPGESDNALIKKPGKRRSRKNRGGGNKATINGQETPEKTTNASEENKSEGSDNAPKSKQRKRKFEKKNPEEGDSAEVPKKKRSLSNSKKGHWTDENNLALINKIMKYLKKIKSSDSFSRGFKKIDWEQVKIENYSAKVCMNQLPAILSRVRDKKTMLEAVVEAHNYYLHNFLNESTSSKLE